MLVTMVLSHGTGLKSAAAILATTVALLLTALLAVLAVGAAHITGLSSEGSQILTLGHTGISISGLVLAGMVIGALGVLDDVTVSQASTVMALRRANASWSAIPQAFALTMKNPALARVATSSFDRSRTRCHGRFASTIWPIDISSCAPGERPLARLPDAWRYLVNRGCLRPRTGCRGSSSRGT